MAWGVTNHHLLTDTLATFRSKGREGVVEFVWIAVGAFAAWFLISYRGTKREMRRSAGVEFAGFWTALRDWDMDRDDYEKQAQAMHHFVTFAQRYSDFMLDSTGRSLPAQRAVMASYFIEHMIDMGYVDAAGRPSIGVRSGAVFWSAVKDLKDLMQGLEDSLGGMFDVPDEEPEVSPGRGLNASDTVSGREQQRARLVALMGRE